MKPSSLLILSATLLVAGCGSHDNSTVVDNKQWLAEQDGPKVEGVNATLLKAAHDADAAGDWRSAAGYYKQLSDKLPDNKEIEVSLADDIRKLGDSDNAMAVYDTVLKKDPYYAPAMEGKGLALMQKNDFDGASQILLQLAQSGKATWRSYNAVGIIAASRQSPAAAKPYFDRALQMSPNNPSILNNLGLSQALGRDFNSGIATLTQASVLSTSRPAFRRQIDLNTALVYASAGKLENAEAIAREYFTGPELSNNMGFYAHLAKDDQLARTYLSMALTQSKRFYPRAWDNLQALNGNGGGQSDMGTTIIPMNNASATPPAMEPQQPQLQQQAMQPTMQPSAVPTIPPVQVQPPMPPQAQAQPQPLPMPLPAAPEQPQIQAVRPTIGYLTPPPGAQPLSEAAQATQQQQPYVPAAAPAMAPPPVNIANTPPAQLIPAAGSPSSGMPIVVPVQPGGGIMMPAAQPQQPAQQAQQQQSSPGAFQSVGNWLGSMLDY